jgi:hypothetical protein
MQQVWEEFSQEMGAFFTDLNWTYIFIFVMVMMGIKDNQEFAWWKKFLARWNLDLYASWIAGIVLMPFFVYFAWVEGYINTSAELGAYISSTLRSYVSVIAFSDILIRKLRKLGDTDKKTKT